jgi:predicted transcriptional regulator
LLSVFPRNSNGRTPTHKKENAMAAATETVADLIEARKARGKRPSLIVAQHTDTVKAVLELLIAQNVYSCPVSKDGEVIGFADLLDVLAFVLREEKEHASTTGPKLFQKLEMELDYKNTPIESIVNISGTNPFEPVAPTRSLNEIMSMFGRNEKPILRVPIVENGKVTDVVTQTDLLHHVHSQGQAALGAVASATVGELGLGNHEFTQAAASEPALVALGKMIHPDHMDESVALTDTDGTILSTLSAKDLKVLTTGPESWRELDATAVQLCSKSRSMADTEMATSITVKTTDTLWHVVQMLAATKVHRLYVVGEGRNPVGVIRLTDLFGALDKGKQ